MQVRRSWSRPRYARGEPTGVDRRAADETASRGRRGLRRCRHAAAPSTRSAAAQALSPRGDRGGAAVGRLQPRLPQLIAPQVAQQCELSLGRACQEVRDCAESVQTALAETALKP